MLGRCAGRMRDRGEMLRASDVQAGDEGQGGQCSLAKADHSSSHRFMPPAGGVYWSRRGRDTSPALYRVWFSADADQDVDCVTRGNGGQGAGIRRAVFFSVEGLLPDGTTDSAVYTAMSAEGGMWFIALRIPRAQCLSAACQPKKWEVRRAFKQSFRPQCYRTYPPLSFCAGYRADPV
jgi:hypothetical protein